MDDHSTQEMFEAERMYLSFFHDTPKYNDRIKAMISMKEIRLIVDLNDLRVMSEERVKKLLENSFVELSSCQKALKSCLNQIDPLYEPKRDQFFIGFEGSFGSRHLNPRSLQAVHLGNMVCLEGIVTKMSSIRSKLERSVHYCPTTKKVSERRYADMTSLEPYPSSGAYPTKDDQGNLLETEFGLCGYKNHQTFTIQEMPEHTPAGQMPRFMEVVLEHDLVDSCKAGDRVYVVGQYRQLPGKRGGYTSCVFRSVVIANNVYQFTKSESTTIGDNDIKIITGLAKRRDILDVLTRSIAPSIYGHESIKRAVLCQMLGGVERVLLNGTRIRGDINLLLLGDPSVAKSQFLRFVLQSSGGRAVATTGRGSSGVGLTAAVTTDRESGQRMLEPGAMVLADRGIVCIDEFDKMSDADRTAIHEVMEQGRVTISKAGIQARLNARCSVLAAANPVYGRYDEYKTPMENIGLQDSLLSRFDLLFTVLDKVDEEMDLKLSEFVLKSHMYRAPGEEDGQVLSMNDGTRVEMVGGETAAGDAGPTQVFEDGAQSQCLTKQFLEKYIQTARQMKPKLGKEACRILVNKYCDLRAQEAEMAENGGNKQHRTQPVTVRTLETLFRLASAHAKGRMNKTVSARDAEAAAELVSFVMFREVLTKAGVKRRARDQDDEEDNEDNDDVDDLVVVREPKRRRAEPASNEAMEVDTATQPQEPIATVAAITKPQLEAVTKLVSRIFSDTRETSLKMENVVAFVSKESGNTIDRPTIMQALQRLYETNKLMLVDDDVYII